MTRLQRSNLEAPEAGAEGVAMGAAVTADTVKPEVEGGGNPEGSFWFALHGSNPSHATDECHTLSAKREERLAWGDGGHLSARPVEYHTHTHAPEPWGQPVHPRAVEQIL